MTVVSVVIIGNEILTGKFADENGPFFIRRFRELGVDLHRMVTIVDDIDAIADEVARCAASSDHVFTTGGVGPTHDDMTFEGVAKAFDLPLVLEPKLVALMERFNMPTNQANLRMATLPQGATLRFAEGAHYPVIGVRNVWVLPGVPGLVKRKFELVAPLLAGEPVLCVKVYAGNHETDVAMDLAGVQAAHPAVDIGSYPRFEADDHRLIVTLESRDRPAVLAARDAVLPHLDVVRVEGP